MPRTPVDVAAGGRVIVDLGAIAANWRRLRELAGPACNVAGVVKADGYGLGLVPVARTLAAAGCRTLFVALPEEGAALAVTLEDAFPDVRIAVLSGPLPPFERGAGETAWHRSLVPVLNSPEQLGFWREFGRGRPAMLHLDTGMGRLGLSAAEMARLVEEPDWLAGLHVTMVLSHLACADEPAHPMNALQRQTFERVTAALPKMSRSLAASSGMFLGAEFHYDMVRIGAALYGINPLAGLPNPMRQVATVQARVIQTRDLLPGECVGYGATWKAGRASRVATIAVGYADGILRAAGNSATCRIGPFEAPMIGRISMDLLTIDVSAVPPDAVRPGTFVDLVGPLDDLDRLARDSGTIGYEVLTRLGQRLPRSYVTGAT